MNDVPPSSRPDPADHPTAPLGAVPAAGHPDPTRSLPDEPHPASYAAAGAGTPGGVQDTPPGRWQRVRERAWSLRAVVAVALASVLLGGLGGAALASAGKNEDGDGRGAGRHGLPGGPHGRFGQQGGPGQPGVPGQGVPGQGPGTGQGQAQQPGQVPQQNP